MLPPLIRRARKRAQLRSRERGFTMALVAGSLVAIIAMAALSIDVGTLYQAKAEAQRSADAAALAAARVISLSGITGDPTNADGSWATICGGASSPASLAAINVAQQNLIGGVPPSPPTVNYGAGSAGASNPDCSSGGPNFANFGVNPVVTVTVQRANLPIFFARIFSLFGSNFSSTSVSATASAEVYNPSQSGPLASGMIPVQPRCVKPLIVANNDPGNFGNPLVNANGTTVSPGVYQLGSGVIGETFTIGADCKSGAPDCETGDGNLFPDNPPKWNGTFLEYIPAVVNGTPGAVPACSNANPFQQAMGGCDQTTLYACGQSLATQADLTINPGGATGDTSTATQCLTHSAPTYGGADSLAGGTTPDFPFQVKAGDGNPLKNAGLVDANDIITSSSSIVTLPIGYFGTTGLPTGVNQPFVTIAGYLQVFVQSIDPANGNLVVTVLNVAGCGNAATNPPVFGTSPVPVRLIKSP
jgi:Flp pilus assembly protein TadG